MTPHRDRAPQEITPVHIEPASRTLPPARRHPTPATPGPASAGSVAARVAASPPTEEEIAHDVAQVRRRALATAVYGVGALATASTVGLADVGAWPAFALPAVTITLFCSVATVAGTFWTWLGARRLGDAGVSVFDAIDGSWREAASRAPRAGDARRAAPAVPDRARADAARGALRGEAAGRAPAAPVRHAAHQVPAAPEVLASRWGAAVLRAVDDRAGVAHLVGELGPADREMIPDVLPTADVLVRRVGELATTLHELDRDAPPSLLAEVEQRLADARRAATDPPDHDQARRLELLGRQQETLADLGQRRQQLTARIESAGLMLQNMRLDLLRLRSAGIDAALGELTSATREATALSRDIGRALDVAAELRKD